MSLYQSTVDPRVLKRGGIPGVGTYCWLQITVNKIVLVHESKSFGHLECNSVGLALRELSVEVALEVSVFNVFHVYEHAIHGLVPAKTLNKP